MTNFNFAITPALILDVALLLVLAGTVFYYSKKGFLAGLIDLVGNLAALIAAWVVSDVFSPTIFERWFKSGLITSTAQTLQEQGTYNISNLIDALGNFLPQQFLQSIRDTADALLHSQAPDLAQQIVENLIAPLVVPIISIVMFFAAFVACKVVIAFFVAVLSNVNRIPLVGSVNKTLGCVVGLVAGAINVLIALCLLWAVVAITRDGLSFLNNEILSGSFLYTAFSTYNPFV